MLHPGVASDASRSGSELVFSVHLADVSVRLCHSPLEHFELIFIQGGFDSARFAGLLPDAGWSASISAGERLNRLQKGCIVTISGTNVTTGRPLKISPITTIDPGMPTSEIVGPDTAHFTQKT